MAGLNIRIEYRRGATRTGTGADGKQWSRRMHAHYGHIARTKGTDGDELDVYIGPETDFGTVYAITQLKAPEFKEFDEQKFMLGFKNAEAAKACYLKHYPDPKIFGGMKAMPFEEFEAKAMSEKNHGKKIAADQRRFVEMNLHLLPRGEKVAATSVMGGPGAAALSAQFSAERGVSSPFVADLGGGGDFMQYPRPGGGRAVHSRSGSGYGFKTAAESRLGKIEDRLDDVGLSILAAPYVARGVAKHLAHRPGRLGAVGRAAQVAADAMHKHENKMEVAGLALVAPGVIKPLAKRIDKTLPAAKTATLADLSPRQIEALEKVAARYIPDFEYMTEAEKLANLATMTGKAVGKLQAVGTSMKQGLTNAADNFQTARAASRHAAGIQKIQKARDFRVGMAQGAGSTPVSGPVRQGVDPVRAQRIAEQRQALESYRKSKGLGTSAERAASNRAAMAPAAPAQPPAAPAQPPVVSANSRVRPGASPAPAAPGNAAPATGNVRPGVTAPASGNVRPGVAAPAQAPAPAAAPAAPAASPYARPANGAGTNTAPAAAPAAAAPAQQAGTGIIDTLHSYLPDGTPRWAVPAAMAGAGGLAAGAMLSGNKQSALEHIPLAAKLAALNARTVTQAVRTGTTQARPARGLLSRITGGGVNNVSKAGVAPGATAFSKAAPAAADAAAPAAGAAAAGAEKPLLSAGTMAKATGIGLVGLGLYAGKQGIDSAASLAQGHRHITPPGMPDYGSVVR